MLVRCSMRSSHLRHSISFARGFTKLSNVSVIRFSNQPKKAPSLVFFSTRSTTIRQQQLFNQLYKRFLSATATLPEHMKLAMPALSPTMTEGNLAKWLKKEGDKINPGDVMAEVETDKATVAFEAVEAGYLAKILVPEGTKGVPLGKIVAILVDNPADVPKFKDYKLEATASAAPASAAAPSPPPSTATTTAPPPPPPPSQPPPAPSAPAQTAAQTAPSSGRIVASPAARRIASELGINLSGIEGTGPDHRIVAADVLESKAVAKPEVKAAVAAPVLPTAAVGDYRDIPHSNIRKIIAQRLLQSKQQIPHYYLTTEVNMDKILKVRKELNDKLEKEKTKDKLSVNDFVIKASALALRKVPTVNSSWMDDAIREYNYVDVSVAVTTDRGLITPIVKDADIKGVLAISRDMKDLAARARDNKLKPHEFQGGTFSVSNLGMFGVKQFAAIINPPQAAILAVGTTETRVVVNPNAKPGESPYTTSNIMSVTLSCDHRVVDGAVGAQWLSAFKSLLEDPVSMLL